MAQFVVTANLSSSVIPFSAALKGQSVIMPNRGDATAGPNRDFGGDTLEAAVNIPQLYWAENVMPTQEGYMAVDYGEIVAPVGKRTTHSLTVYDGYGSKVVLIVCDDNTFYGISNQYDEWKQIPVPAGFTGKVTSGTAYGTVYLHFTGVSKLFSLELETLVMTEVIPEGLDLDVIEGICDSQSYLVAWGKNIVAWSSATDSLDFVPSDITGAGAGTPEGIKGQIVHCKTISKGFIIYTSAIIMAAEYSGNVRFPWIFRALNNSAGVNDFRHIAQDSALASHYAWTAAGLLEVTALQCTPKYGQLTDFLAGQVWEEFDPVSKSIPRTKLTAQVKVKVAIVATRFFCVSYGRPDLDYYEYVNVFDLVLQRWGRLKRKHYQCIEIVADTEMDSTSWEEMAETTWEGQSKSWNSFARWNNNTALAKKTLGFIGDGSNIEVAQLMFNPVGAKAVIVLGRYQLQRGHTCSLQTVLLDGIEEGKTNLTVSDAISIDGMDYVIPMNQMTQLHQGSMQRKYGARNVGKNHSLVIEGSFNLTSVELAFTNSGRR